MTKILKALAVSLLVVQASAAMADTKSNQITKSTQSLPVGAAGATSIPGAAIVGIFTVVLFAVGASSGSHGSNVGN